MSLEKLKAEAVALRKNIDNVYSAGYAAGKADGDGSEEAYEEGVAAERKRFWDGVFQDGKRTDFKYGFAGDGWYNELLNFQNRPYTIRPVDLSTGTRSAMGMFYYFARGITFGDDMAFDMTEICRKMDLSKVLSTQSMFQAAYVKNVTLDLSNVTTVNAMFAGNDGGYRNNITLTVSEKCTNYTNFVSYGTSLTHFIFTDGSVVAANISFDRCNELDGESIQSIINALQDRTGLTALTVTFHTDVVNRLTDDQLAQIAAKNWQLG